MFMSQPSNEKSITYTRVHTHIHAHIHIHTAFVLTSDMQELTCACEPVKNRPV